MSIHLISTYFFFCFVAISVIVEKTQNPGFFNFFLFFLKYILQNFLMFFAKYFLPYPTTVSVDIRWIYSWGSKLRKNSNQPIPSKKVVLSESILGNTLLSHSLCIHNCNVSAPIFVDIPNTKPKTLDKDMYQQKKRTTCVEFSMKQ